MASASVSSFRELDVATPRLNGQQECLASHRSASISLAREGARRAGSECAVAFGDDRSAYELEAGHLYVVVEGRGSVSVAPRASASKLDGSGPIDRSRCSTMV